LALFFKEFRHWFWLHFGNLLVSISMFLGARVDFPVLGVRLVFR
jgi:hypothetical protein